MSPRSAKVVAISLDEPLVPLEVEAAYDEAVVFVFSHGRPLGRLRIAGLRVVTPELQAALVTEKFGHRLWQRELRAALELAAGLDGLAQLPVPEVTVVICTRNRPDDLARCLDSLSALRTSPVEVIVVDSAPSDERAAELCADRPVRYLMEPVIGQSRARNRGIVEARGELVAFTDDDVVVDPGWLDALGHELLDPLVGAITGLVAPLELETPAQVIFEMHGGFDRGYERTMFDGTRVGPTTSAGRAGAGANVVFPRAVFEQVGLFAEDLGPGTPARASDDNDMFCRILEAGLRIVYEPARFVWHGHRRTERELRELMYGYGASSLAFATKRLGEGDASALRLPVWWWGEHLPGDLLSALRRGPNAIPLRYALDELRGTLAGPWLLHRSRQSRKGIAAIALPRPSASSPTPRVVSNETPALSIVIPTHNRRELLVRLLDALGAQTYPSERMEVVAVLDGCTDGSAGAIRALDLPYRLELVEQDGRGAAEARGAGVAAAREELVLFVDDDIILEPGCVAAHADAHRQGDGTIVALGYCPPVSDGSWWSLVLRAWWEDHYRRKRIPGHRFGFADMVTGNTSLTKSALHGAGGFDPAFRGRREDWELGIRLLEHGSRFVHCHDAVGHHHLDLDLERAVARQRTEAAGDVELARKHPSTAVSLPFAGYLGQRHAARPELMAGIAERADRLELHRVRRPWRRLVERAMRQSYLLGLADAGGSDAELRALVAAAGEPVRAFVDLADPCRLSLPPLGAIALEVVEQGSLIGRVDPRYPGAQWDWQHVIDRTVRGSSPAAAAAVAVIRSRGGAERGD
jgi:glycosyltransferase involved in cell wall biosynthesis